MKTVRIALKSPLYHYAAGSVFELSDEVVIEDWPEDERLRDRQNFSSKQAYILPDDGRGNPIALLLSNVAICPEHLFEGTDLRLGAPKITQVQTRCEHTDFSEEKFPCGKLTSDMVSLKEIPAQKRWQIIINLPPFEEVAEKMVLYDVLRKEQVMEYVLRNYSRTDTVLDWDVSDLNPGFYTLQICFPGAWVHYIRFVKQFPMLIDPDNMPPAPEKPWQKMARAILETFKDGQAPQTPDAKPEGADDLRNVALELCLEWGEMFNKPTQERMKAKYPKLGDEEADELDRQAREVRSFVYGLCEEECEGKILESDIHFQAKRKYPWLSAANFNRLKNVGMYYARR